MKMMKLLIAELLAAMLAAFTGSTIVAPNLNRFTSPIMSFNHPGFNPISPSQIGTSPSIFAPLGNDLLYGGGIGSHFKPKLMTNNWTNSMQQSEINQMFVILARGVGHNNIA